MNAAIWGVIGIVVGALITGIVQVMISKADYTQKIQETCVSLIDPLKEQIDDLKEELQDWKDWASRLVEQVKGLGHDPVPFKSSKKRS